MTKIIVETRKSTESGAVESSDHSVGTTEFHEEKTELPSPSLSYNNEDCAVHSSISSFSLSSASLITKPSFEDELEISAVSLKPSVAPASSLAKAVFDPTIPCFCLRLQLHKRLWRKIVVPTFYNFRALHAIIQGAFGWKGQALYKFDFLGEAVTATTKYNNRPEPTPVQLSLPLAHYIRREGATLLYTYDFDAEWQVSITVESKFDFTADGDMAVSYPVDVPQTPVAVIAGEGVSPGEDSGDGAMNVWDVESVNHEVLVFVRRVRDVEGHEQKAESRERMWWEEDESDDSIGLPADTDV